MDNLTHSLIGAVLGQAGLKRKTGLAMTALIIAANLPDIDAVAVVYGVESLALRRGITHGPIAMLVLPLLLALGLRWFDGWQARRGKRPDKRLPVNFKWLLALCYLGCLTHPLFDWFNNYGVRLLEPFSHQWFYGDTLFIIDPWIIAMLGSGVWFSLRRERTARPDWENPARLAWAAVLVSIGLNFAISAQAVSAAHRTVPQANLAVANALPLAFWERQVLVRTDQLFGSYRSVPLLAFKNENAPQPTNMSDPRIAEWAKSDPAARAFLFWSRMPVAELHEDHIVLRDQRFMDPRTARQFSVTLRPPK
jgi:inner membrane protein